MLLYCRRHCAKQKRRKQIYAVRSLDMGYSGGYSGGMSVGNRSPSSPKARWRDASKMVRTAADFDRRTREKLMRYKKKDPRAEEQPREELPAERPKVALEARPTPPSAPSFAAPRFARRRPHPTWTPISQDSAR